MSMIGNYLRVTPDEAADVLAKPGAILDVLYPEGDEESREGRHLDIDKAWHAIHFLLNGDPWEGDLPLFHAVLGGEPIGEVDVGYGPARHLGAEEVRHVAEALGDIPASDLLERFDAEAMNDEEVYPHGWGGDEGERDYIADHYLRLVDFFRRAAAAGDAMILYLN